MKKQIDITELDVYITYIKHKGDSNNKMLIKSLDEEYIYYGLANYLISDEPAEIMEGFFLTPLKGSEENLAMNIYLCCIENKRDKPFLRFQNDRKSKFNSNWVKMYFEGTINKFKEMDTSKF